MPMLRPHFYGLQSCHSYNPVTKLYCLVPAGGKIVFQSSNIDFRNPVIEFLASDAKKSGSVANFVVASDLVSSAVPEELSRRFQQSLSALVYATRRSSMLNRLDRQCN